ncbi:MAG: RuBisCO large subunit C-terminal-like domain-containing protein [Roseibium sp.]
MSHPMGVSAGVVAFRQAAEAARAGIAPDEHAKSCPELAEALKAFKKP